MTCKEVLKKLKKELRIKKIEVVEKGVKSDVGVCGFYGCIHTQDWKIAFEEIILHSDNIVEKVVCLLHEIEHHKKGHEMNPLEREEFYIANISYYTNKQRKMVIQAEKDAWDSAWEMAIKFGLNKNRNFKKKFLQIKTSGLASYKAPLKECCV